MQLTLQTAKEMYASGIPSIVKFALENYPELAKPKYPKSWEELGKVSGYIINGDCSISKLAEFIANNENKDISHTQAQSEVSLALAQLSQLMAVYRNGWLPDWEDSNKVKWVIIIENNNVKIIKGRCNYELLSFPDEPTAKAFATDHENLILQIKNF